MTQNSYSNVLSFFLVGRMEWSENEGDLAKWFGACKRGFLWCEGELFLF